MDVNDDEPLHLSQPVQEGTFGLVPAEGLAQPDYTTRVAVPGDFAVPSFACQAIEAYVSPFSIADVLGPMQMDKSG